MAVDPTLFPRLAQYITELPNGLDSYPTALTKADFSLILRAQLAPILAEEGLPERLKATLTAPWKPGDWISTTHYVALCALARDRLWKTEHAYDRGMFDVATEMYKSPVYRLLFFMFGPGMVAMSAAKRWQLLHQGTELVVKKQNKESLELILTYPHKIFSHVAMQSLGGAFCAITYGSRGKDPSFLILSVGDKSAEGIIRWTS